VLDVVLEIFLRVTDAFSDLDETGEMHDGLDAMRRDDVGHEISIPDRTLDEDGSFRDLRSLALRKVIQDDYFFAALHKSDSRMRADVSGAASDKDGFIHIDDRDDTLEPSYAWRSSTSANSTGFLSFIILTRRA